MARACDNRHHRKAPKKKYRQKHRITQIRKQNAKKQQLKFQERCDSYEQMKFSDFEQLQYIGAGSFGIVRIVKVGDHYMALKSIRKSMVEKRKCESAVIRERKILFLVRDCPFCTKLFRTFRTEKFVHFLMELYLGGDLRKYARSLENRIVPESTVKFIAVCIIEGLKFLRAKNYVLRDLKAENVVINAAGYCCLADFGFCEQLEPGQMFKNYVGTKSHFAPEIVRCLPNDHGVDLWALGVTLYELLTGKLPFVGGIPDCILFRKIRQGIQYVIFPEHLSPAAVDMIKSLCNCEAGLRLGYKSIIEIEKHAWFKRFHLKAVRNQTRISPIKRNLVDESDFHYLKARKKRIRKRISPSDCNDGPAKNASGWDAEF